MPRRSSVVEAAPPEPAGNDGTATSWDGGARNPPTGNGVPRPALQEQRRGRIRAVRKRVVGARDLGAQAPAGRPVQAPGRVIVAGHSGVDVFSSGLDGTGCVGSGFGEQSRLF